MESMYLRKLGKMTVKQKTINGIIFKEIPNKTYDYTYIKNNLIDRKDYNSIDLSIDDLRDSIKERNIEYIYHFTSINNLFFILRKGFIPRCFLYNKTRSENFKTDFVRAKYPSELNDPNRRDDLLYATAFSISQISYRLLQEYKKRYPDRHYCILKINVNLLLQMYKRGEYFFYHNAASNMFKKEKNIYTRGQAFNKMFYDELEINTSSFSGILTRNFESKYPTSDQAELLINGFLSTKSVVEIIFNNESDKKDFFSKIDDNKAKEMFLPICRVDEKMVAKKM